MRGRAQEEREVDDGPVDRDPQFVEAIARGFRILEVFTADDTVLGNQEIAERTGLPRPTVSRLCYTLTRLGYLEYLPRFAKYQLGSGAVLLGQAALAGMGIRRIARPLMERLAEEMGGSVSLGRRDRLSVLYIEHCPPRSAVALQLGIGSRLPLALSAMGRACYAAASGEERARIDAEIRRRFPDRWPAARDGLREAVDMHAAGGFAVSLGDWQPEVHAAGAAVALPSGSVVGLNCGAPAFTFGREKVLAEVGPRLAAMAQELRALASGQF